MEDLRLGIYQHYKGMLYEVIGIAKHSETLEDFVVYKQLYDNHSLWVRPLKMFEEEFVIEGISTPRFKYIDKE